MTPPLWLTILLAWLLADLLSGIVHWYEERYMLGPYQSQVIQGIYEDNRMHHVKPTLMLKHSWWQSIEYSALVALPFAFLFYLAGFPTVIWLGAAFGSVGNLIHRWAHTPKHNLPKWILFMQWTGLFIDAKQHGEHHRFDGRLILKEESRIRYCPMTKWLNPWLDLIYFWDILEWILGLFGKKPVPIPIPLETVKQPRRESDR